MAYRIRFYRKDERGRERQLAAATVNVPTPAGALRWALASLEQTRSADPALFEQIVGVRIGPWIEAPASAAPTTPSAPELVTV